MAYGNAVSAGQECVLREGKQGIVGDTRMGNLVHVPGSGQGRERAGSRQGREWAGNGQGRERVGSGQRAGSEQAGSG